MPSGRVHSLATLVGMTAVPTAMYAAGFQPAEMVACAVGFAITLKVNPDLDLATRFPKKQPAKWLWWAIWFPYAKLFGHRSFWSHAPIIGTALRVAYVLIYVTILAEILGVDIYGSQSLYWILYGMALSDVAHGLLDVSVSFVKENYG